MTAPFVPRPTATFQVTVTTEATVLDIAGDLDSTTTGRLADHLGAELSLRPPALVTDASEVTFCATRALTVLLAADEDARAARVPFAIVTRRRALLRPLALLGLDRQLDIQPTLDDALHRLATSRS